MEENPDQRSTRSLVRAILEMHANAWYVCATPTQREAVLDMAVLAYERELKRQPDRDTN